MALVKFGGGITAMSGSIAGNTFARNRSGAYIRSRTKPVNPNTDRQNDVRAVVAFLVERWSETLTAAERAAWDLYASNVTMKNKLGESIKLTGFNHYIRSNASRIRAGNGAIDAGPVIFELPAQDPAFAVTASEAAQTFSVTFNNALGWATEDGAALIIHGGRPQNAQRNFFAGPWRFSRWLPGIDPGGAVSPAECTSHYAIAEGQHLWVYARITMADGRLSEIFRADIIVAA